MAGIVDIATAGGFMALLGVLLAAALAFAGRRLHVADDPRIDTLMEMLPRVNCGACGSAGCRPFAEALLAGAVLPGGCTVNSATMTEAIAGWLGVEAGQVEKRVARLACAGGSHVAYTRARYQGLASCRAAALTAGGGKGCVWGCVGLGECASVCRFGAIAINRFGLPIVDEARCTACGDCVAVCPKDLFSLQPLSHRLWVACRNRDLADEAEAHCELVCTACGRCSADAPEGLIRIENNLATIDYAKNALASRIAIERCPTGAIVWLDRGGALRGAEARPLRKEPLPRVEPLPRL